MLRARLVHVLSHYYSLERGTSVEDAVRYVLDHSVEECNEILHSSGCASVSFADVQRDISELLNNTSALEVCKSYCELCRSSSGSNNSANCKPTFLPSITEDKKREDVERWFLSLGLGMLLENASQLRLEATARAFGLPGADANKAPSRILRFFVLSVTLDSEYHGSCLDDDDCEDEVVTKEGLGASIEPLSTHIDALTHPTLPRDCEDSNRVLIPRQLDRVGQTVENGAGTMVSNIHPAPSLQGEKQPRKRAVEPSKVCGQSLEEEGKNKKVAAKRASQSGSPKVVAHSATPVQRNSSSIRPPHKVITDLCNSENRNLSPTLFHCTPHDVALKMLTQPQKMKAVDLERYRPPISAELSEWALTKWYTVEQLSEYVQQHSIEAPKVSRGSSVKKTYALSICQYHKLHTG